MDQRLSRRWSIRTSRHLPGNISTDQFIKFSEALLKGQKDGWKILKTVMKDKIREVV